MFVFFSIKIKIILRTSVIEQNVFIWNTVKVADIPNLILITLRSYVVSKTLGKTWKQHISTSENTAFRKENNKKTFQNAVRTDCNISQGCGYVVVGSYWMD